MRQIGLKMDEQLVSLFKVFFVVIFTVTVAQTQRLETIPSSVVLKAGESTSLLCRYGKPVSYCLINLPGESKPLVLSDKWASPTAGYNYFGEGLDAGQCGVTIDRIRDQNHGNMTCQVLSDGNQFEGHIDIIVARPPLPPELDFIEPNDRRTTFEVDEQIRIKCVSRDGRPGANLTWYLEDEPVPSGVGYPETIETVVGNTTLLTVTLEITRQIQATDDGKSLICRASHLADNRGPRETRMQLSVRYRPQPQPEIGIYGLTLDRTAIINVTIVSNPRPQTEWIIDGVSIPQGTQNGRYESYEPISLRNGAYNVSLSIAGLTLEDTTKIYHLKASNEFGVQEYRVRISSLDTPPSNGLELGAIVGISVVAIIVLVAIVLLVFAKVTRRWCFGERSPPPPASETNDDFHPGVDSALLERPNNEAKIAKNHQQPANDHKYNNNRRNGEQRVYNPTTVPIDRNTEQNVPMLSKRDVNSKTNDAKGGEGDGDEVGRRDLLTQGNELGIPESRFSRWLPKDQREILQKQAQILVSRGQSPQRQQQQQQQQPQPQPQQQTQPQPTSTDIY